MNFRYAFTRASIIGRCKLEDSDPGSWKKPRLCHPWKDTIIIQSNIQEQGLGIQSLQLSRLELGGKRRGGNRFSIHNLRQSRQAKKSRRVSAGACLRVKPMKLTGPWLITRYPQGIECASVRSLRVSTITLKDPPQDTRRLADF